jgi:hypothetical protein
VAQLELNRPGGSLTDPATEFGLKKESPGEESRSKSPSSWRVNIKS